MALLLKARPLRTWPARKLTLTAICSRQTKAIRIVKQPKQPIVIHEHALFIYRIFCTRCLVGHDPARVCTKGKGNAQNRSFYTRPHGSDRRGAPGNLLTGRRSWPLGESGFISAGCSWWSVYGVPRP